MTCLRSLRYSLLRKSWGIASILALALFSVGLLAAQVTVSAGPPLLFQVKTIYVAPSSDDFVRLIKTRLEKWSAVGITSNPEEADAVLTCQTETTIVPAKVAIHRTTAEVSLVDRRSRRPIWKTTKSASFELDRLADNVVEQLKMDWRKSGSGY
ncbi:MAG TPA: hypothetical protein VEH30_09125 [Terriglobales bacterium]|nr:hypothetical protein [Terriglobales bacterium]